MKKQISNLSIDRLKTQFQDLNTVNAESLGAIKGGSGQGDPPPFGEQF